MPILDIDPGSNPEAAGTLYFYREGQAVSTGLQVTTAGAITTPGVITATGGQVITGDVSVTTGDVVVETAGKGLQIKEGSNARMGTATLVGGTVDVANTSVTANTVIFLSRATTGGTEGTLSSVIDPGVDFTINSSSGTDTSEVNWLLIEPA